VNVILRKIAALVEFILVTFVFVPYPAFGIYRLFLDGFSILTQTYQGWDQEAYTAQYYASAAENDKPTLDAQPLTE